WRAPPLARSLSAPHPAPPSSPTRRSSDLLLEAWGIDVAPKLVLDTRNDSFPIPVDRDLGGLVVRDVQQLPYPFFVHVPRDGMSDGIITGQLAAAVMHFSSPVEVEEKAGAGKGGEDGEEAPPRK